MAKTKRTMKKVKGRKTRDFPRRALGTGLLRGAADAATQREKERRALLGMD